MDKADIVVELHRLEKQLDDLDELVHSLAKHMGLKRNWNIEKLFIPIPKEED